MTSLQANAIELILGEKINSMHFAIQTLFATFKWNTFLQSMNQHAFNVSRTPFLFY